MRRYKRLITMLLLSVLLCTVTACGGKDEMESEGNMKELAEGVLMVVGNESVTYEEAFAYVYMLKQQYEPAMGGDIWDFQMGDGVDFESYAKDQIVDLIMQVKIICQQGEKLDIHLTEDEIWEAKNMAVRFMETVSEEDAAEYRLSEELMAGVYEDHILAEKVYEIVTNEVDTNISDAEAKQVTVQYLMVMTKGVDVNGNKVDMNEEEQKQAKKEAKALYKKAKELTTNFYAFAETNTDASEVEITFGENNMPEDFGEAAMALKTDQMSKLITGNNGYYIIYCVNDYDEDATMAKKEAIIAERKDELFRQKYLEWSERIKMVISTAVWDAIEF